MRHAFFLAWGALRATPFRSSVLVLGAAVALFLPLFTYLGTEAVEEEMLRRATESPILVGREGNEFDLTLGALYFRAEVRDTVTEGLRADLQERGYGRVIPLYLRHSAAGIPVVGTSLAYFEARGLRVAEGRRMALLGEVVAGAEAARRHGLAVGNTLRSDLTNLYNLAGAYPKILHIVGILEPTGGPDDEVLIADVKTTWFLDGRLHGHEEVRPEDSLNPEAEEDETLEATAAIFIFQEMDESNRASFHMHGEETEAPLSAVLVFPKDQRAEAQMLGDYALEETLQAVVPESVIRSVLSIVARVEEGLALFFGLVAISTVLFFALTIVLTLRLRRAEITLMERIGCSPYAIASIVGTEIFLLVAAAALLAALASLGGVALVRTFF